jgi:hypothetical protein
MERDITTVKQSLEEKLKSTHEKLGDTSLIQRYAAANLTDDEIWVLAHIKANNSRVDMEWEGFKKSDTVHQKHIKMHYESLKDRIKGYIKEHGQQL